jgi:hypothetical protein
MMIYSRAVSANMEQFFLGFFTDWFHLQEITIERVRFAWEERERDLKTGFNTSF